MTKPPRSWLIRDDSNQHNVRLTATPVNGTGGWSDYEVPREGIHVVPASALAAAEEMRDTNLHNLELWREKAKALAAERDEAIAALEKVMALIDAQVLVRSTDDDADTQKFLAQGVRLINALQPAQALLERAKGGEG